MRGCFGGCTFCSITAHEGRLSKAAARQSVLAEIRQMAADPRFKGVISDMAARRPTCIECVAAAPRSKQVAAG